MRRANQGGGSRVTLPITPMLDMTFQLLFFFDAGFQPASPEGQIEMALATRGGPPGLENPLNPPQNGPPREALTVVVRSHVDGDISALFVRNSLGKEDAVGGLDGLRRHLATRRDPDPPAAIRVQADGKLRTARLIAVMDACKAAGFASVTLVEPENPARPDPE